MKRKEIFVQTRRLERITLTRHRPQSDDTAVCEACGKATQWLTIPEVMNLAGYGVRELQNKIASGELDIRITDQDMFLICAESVVRPRSNIHLTTKEDTQ